MNLKKRTKFFILIILGLLAVTIGMSGSIINNTLGLNIVVNNTNLAPSFAGEPPGTNERIQNITYWSNDSDRELFVFAHANTASSTLSLNLSINGTVVEWVQRKPVAGTESSFAYVHGIIPRYANYSVNITNFHHYEWREYKILSGNVTTTTGTGTGAGCTGNCSFDKIYVNTLTKNDTTDTYGSYINVTGTGFTAISIIDNIKSRFTLNDGSFFDIISEYIGGSNKSEIFGNPDLLELVVSNGSVNVIDIYHNRTEQIIDSRTYKTNSTHMDYGGANITGVNNSNMTGTLYMNFTSVTSADDTDIIQSVYNKTSGNPIMFLDGRGIQWWNFTLAGVDVGHIRYSTPGGTAGISFTSGDDGNRTDIKHIPPSAGLLGLRVSQNLTVISNVSLGQNVKLTTAGKGITMLSPDGNDWCVTVTNAGALNVATTPCS